jgi:hypothetical protein
MDGAKIYAWQDHQNSDMRSTGARFAPAYPAFLV